MKVRRKMGKRGREKLEEELRLKAISRDSGSPMNDRGGLKKTALSPKPPSRLLQGGEGEVIILYHLFPAVSKKIQEIGGRFGWKWPCPPTADSA